MPWRRRRWRGPVGLGLAVAAVVVAAGCGSDTGPRAAGPATTGAPVATTAPVDQGPRAAPRWEELATFSGTGATETPTFGIAPGAIQWRVRYECAAGRLELATLPPSEDPEALAETACPSEGEAFAITSGEARLGIETEGPWRAVVEQQVETPIDEPPLPQMAGATVLGEGEFYSIDEPGSGTARLYQLPDGGRALRFEDFEVFLNTDLVVWLSEASAPTTSEEAITAPHVEIADLKSTIGPQNYLVPDDLPIEAIRSVIIWCPPIRSAYLAATLEP